MSRDGEDPDVGSVAEEAVKLLGALTDWAKDTAQDVDRHLATGAEECTYCPICRTVHTVRQLSPEVRSQLATAATALLQAASTLVATAAQEHASRPGVERIDLDDGADDWSPGDWPEDTDAEEDDE